MRGWVLRFCQDNWNEDTGHFETAATHNWKLTLAQAQSLASRAGLVATETSYGPENEYDEDKCLEWRDPYWDSLLQGKEEVDVPRWIAEYLGTYDLVLIAPDGDTYSLHQV